MEYNNYRIFHVHTWRCRHAGEEQDKEYIEKAIELGADEIYFTDHCPFPENPFRYRMSMDELPEYVSTLQKLKHQYAGQIDIKIGLETEYIPIYDDHYKKLYDSGNFDTFVLGQHFSLLPNGCYTFESKEKISEPKDLANGMMQGMESGLFSVVAHPDQIFRRKKIWDEECKAISREIIDCAARTGVILEQNISNLLGKKKKRTYWPEFWKELPQGVRTMYGVDAHSVAELETNYLKQQELIDNDIRRIGEELIQKNIVALRALAEWESE